MTKRETERVSDGRLAQWITNQATVLNAQTVNEIASMARELQERRRAPDGRNEVVEECVKRLERRSQMLLQRGDARGRSMSDTVEEDIRAIRALKKDHP